MSDFDTILADRFMVPDEHDVPRVCGLKEWTDWFVKNGGNQVALDQVGDTMVSTVFIGTRTLKHVVLWETMIFGGPLDQRQERYDTKQAALRGHAGAIAMAREADEELGRDGRGAEKTYAVGILNPRWNAVEFVKTLTADGASASVMTDYRTETLADAALLGVAAALRILERLPRHSFLIECSPTDQVKIAKMGGRAGVKRR